MHLPQLLETENLNVYAAWLGFLAENRLLGSDIPSDIVVRRRCLLGAAAGFAGSGGYHDDGAHNHYQPFTITHGHVAAVARDRRRAPRLLGGVLVGPALDGLTRQHAL